MSKTGPLEVAMGQAVYNSAHSPKNDEVLIKLKMNYGGQVITAIIDTGSQLNVVSKKVAEEYFQLPIDLSKSTHMMDANGGEGVLFGLIEGVPLTCGGATTHANLYVGTHLPFQLLLGRPWQRGNFVSIDERVNGTYLVFKDPESLRPRFEILVTADAITPRTFQPFKPMKQVNSITVAAEPTPEEFDLDDLLRFEEFLGLGSTETEQAPPKLIGTTYDIQHYLRKIDPLSQLLGRQDKIDLMPILEPLFMNGKATEPRDGLEPNVPMNPNNDLYPTNETRDKNSTPDTKISDTECQTPENSKESPKLQVSSTDEIPEHIRYLELYPLETLLEDSEINEPQKGKAEDATNTIIQATEIEKEYKRPIEIQEKHQEMSSTSTMIFHNAESQMYAEAAIAVKHATRVLRTSVDQPDRLVPLSLDARHAMLIGIGHANGAPAAFGEFALHNVTLQTTCNGTPVTIEGFAYLQLHFPDGDRRILDLFPREPPAPANSDDDPSDTATGDLNPDQVSTDSSDASLPWSDLSSHQPSNSQAELAQSIVEDPPPLVTAHTESTADAAGQAAIAADVASGPPSGDVEGDPGPEKERRRSVERGQGSTGDTYRALPSLGSGRALARDRRGSSQASR
ncbi:hypothetical protein GALMADRAFT_149233 [Galerina marginata CBS 339.88]|uniref:Uncharacterized protein n=1 Tax=Galerina marginata (strain CBS 339.88) TaxID=685588 RepID=A0A067S4R0_GALM3|nr:hypothetical protein GALMADRAFT_149233 [Galerina marginata CBS 339.88]